MTAGIRIVALLISCALFASPAWSDESVGSPAEQPSGPDEPRIPFWSLVTDIPQNSWDGLKTAFSYDALPAWGVIIGSSAVLYHYDEDILNSVQSEGRSWGLGNSVDYTSLIKIGNLTLWSGPKDTASFLYFLGDGTIPIVLSAGMIGTGYFGNSRLYNTGIEMGEALITGSIFDQVIKHIAGRQSPSAATQPRGDWHPFENWKTYSSNTSAFDAFASGHIMTSTVMFTVFEQEYPEYNYFMYPIEVAYLGVLGWGMINVGVHWASDYPMGIAMGYVFATTEVAMHHPDRKKQASNIRFFPGMDPSTGVSTMNAMYTF